MKMTSEEDQDVFEITDFTTASEWERFIARVEEIIHEWKLSSLVNLPPLQKDELATGNWEQHHETLSFGNYSFDMFHHYLQQEPVVTGTETEEESKPNDPHPASMTDILSCENDFPSKAHCLVRWYGLRDFLIIRPSKNNEAISNEDKAKLLLSSICVAVNNTNCFVPVFIQLLPNQQKYYLGVCEGGGFRMSFEMVHLHRTLPQYNHLSGLLNIFRSKVGSSLTDSTPVMVSIRSTYILHDWSLYTWPQPPPDINEFGEVLIPSDLGKLPYGAMEDPIRELQLSVTWTNIAADVVVDNDVHSDLDPLHAPKWSVRVRMADNPVCLLGDYLLEFFTLKQQLMSVEQLLMQAPGVEDEDDENHNYGEALDKLASHPAPIPSLSSIISQTKNHVREGDASNIDDEMLIKILQYIFPDSVSVNEQETNETDNEGALPVIFSTRKDFGKLEEMLKSFKSAYPGSLTWRLALALCKVNYCCGGIPAVAHLWQEVLVEMRHRWENNYTLPCLELGLPNLTCCLLHQKFQMLNCCLERKKAREWHQLKHSSSPSTDSREPSSQSFFSESEGEEDEYFECDDSNNHESKTRNKNNTEETNKELPKSIAEGRLRQLNDLTLLNSDMPLYIPVTQEPSPMTEDLLEEHAEILVQLGTNSEGTALRARMQSACLLSDMEAFKAANPGGSCLEDFVRWYSPRDWIQETPADEEAGKSSTKGHLSARMLLPGNMWQEVWESAQPVPAHRQKRLFDDTKEAEKVLHFLASIKPADLVDHLMPVLVHSALLRLTECVENGPPSLPTRLIEIASKAAKVMHSPRPVYKDVLNMLYEAEVKISQAESLCSKFCSEDNNCVEEKRKTSKLSFLGSSSSSNANLEENTIRDFCLELADFLEVTVPGGSKGITGRKIRRLFADAQRNSHLIVDEKPLASSDGAFGSTDYHSTVTEFPKPSAREFILRTKVPRPTSYSNASPQRMYCLLTQDEFRLSGAFTEDTTFY